MDHIRTCSLIVQCILLPEYDNTCNLSPRASKCDVYDLCGLLVQNESETVATEILHSMANELIAGLASATDTHYVGDDFVKKLKMDSGIEV